MGLDASPRSFSDWVYRAQRNLTRTILAEEAPFLSAACHADVPAHKSLTFLKATQLGVPLKALASRTGETLTELFEYVSERLSARGFLSNEQLAASLDPLRRELGRQSLPRLFELVTDPGEQRECLRRGVHRVGETVLGDYLDGGTAAEREVHLRAWCQEVRLRVRVVLQARALGVVYAYVCGGF